MSAHYAGQTVVPGTGDFWFLTGGGLLVAAIGLAVVLATYLSDERSEARDGDMLAGLGMLVMGVGVGFAGIVLHTTTDHNPASWIAAIIGLACTVGGWRMMAVSDRAGRIARARRWRYQRLLR